MPNPEQLAADVYTAIQRYTNSTARSQQSQEFRIGISDLGTCQERTRRTLAGIPEAEERDALAAFLGTAIGADVEAAVAAMFPDAKRGVYVEVTLSNDQGSFIVGGHPDLVFGWGVADVKTTNGLEVARASGPSRQQRFQRHLYTLGAHQAQMLNVPLEEAQTANVWIDRSGTTHEAYADVDMFSWDVIEEASRWLEDVIYAWRNDEFAAKEPPREWCKVACGHFETCRAWDTDVSGIITDPDTVAAFELYQQGQSLEKEGKRLKKEAEPYLKQVSGTIGNFQIRTTYVNPSEVSYTRKGYDKLQITRLS